MYMKICSKCQKEYPLSSFYKRTHPNHLYQSMCKICANLCGKIYLKKHPNYGNNYQQNRKQRDINYRLSGNLRSRLNMAIKRNIKSGSSVRDLGCSIEELKHHLESKFQLDMTWKNYGEWEIDHIQPLASFDLKDRKQLLKACHYTNLQPLWKKDNSSKGKKFLDL